MNISTELAMKIVKDMKNIINQDLNFIDIKGCIIASTDVKRIGTIHEASLKCISLNSEIIINSDDEYLNCRRGINIPVYLEDEIVGVIGITGKPEDVEKYGKIIKSMTEILIKEAWVRELFIQKREQNRNKIESILFGDYKNINLFTSLIFPYTLIVGNVNPKFENNNDLYKILEMFLARNKKNIFTITTNYIIIFFNSENMQYIENFIVNIQKTLYKNLKFDFKFGVGKTVHSIDEVILSYSEAKNALKYTLNFENEKKYTFYSELDLGILMSDISQNKMNEFIKKVFKNLTEEEIEDFYEIFKCYKNNNGSIKEASESLFMHKNTLQYQLNKIEKLTGYNPRNLQDFSVLDLAFMLNKVITD